MKGEDSVRGCIDKSGEIFRFVRFNDDLCKTWKRVHRKISSPETNEKVRSEKRILLAYSVNKDKVCRDPTSVRGFPMHFTECSGDSGWDLRIISTLWK